MGTLPFLRLVSELALTSQLLYIGLAVLMRQQLAPAAGWALLRSCAVGFSGVLFGLKVQLVCKNLVFVGQTACCACRVWARAGTSPDRPAAHATQTTWSRKQCYDSHARWRRTTQ